LRNFIPPKDFLSKALRNLLNASGYADRIWIFLDQAIVSGGNFLVLFLLARYSDATNVGYYAVAISVVIILQGLQDSIITRPYLVHHADQGIDQREFAGGALSLSLLFSSIAAFVFLIVFYIDLPSERFDEMASIISILVIAIPAYLMREFSRRFLMSKLAVKKVFLWDLLGLLFVCFSLFSISIYSTLDAFLALLGISISYGSLFIIWLYFERRWFVLSIPAIGSTLVTCWSIGRWLAPDRMASELRGYLNHWLSLIFLGPAATGAFAACLSIVALSNPFVLGMLNFMAPKSVRVIHESGIKGLRIQMFVDIGIMATAMFCFAIIITILGKEILAFIFSNNDFSSYANVLTVMGFATAFAASSGPIASALITAKMSRQASLISILMFLTQLIIAPICVYTWGLIGAAFTILIIEMIGMAARLKLFLRISE